jgi:ferrous iron transport protein A
MTVTLDQLHAGQKARIRQLRSAGSIRRRLLDLGLVPGTPIERIMASPAGDPICFRVRGTMLALRASDAAEVAVDIESGPPDDAPR